MFGNRAAPTYNPALYNFGKKKNLMDGYRMVVLNDHRWRGAVKLVMNKDCVA